MKFLPNTPPRKFSVGSESNAVVISDCAHIRLEPEEQVTFVSPSESEYDVVRKSWGYYGTPSLNKRLKAFNLRSALVKNQEGSFYIHLVEKGQESEHRDYLDCDGQKVITWLDDDNVLEQIAILFESQGALSD